MRTLFTSEGKRHNVSVGEVEDRLRKPSGAFWLDIESPDDDDYRLLGETFRFHPLSIEDVRDQNQRPKLEEYDGYMFVVLFVAAFSNAAISFREHHLYLSADFLVSVHSDPEPAYGRLHQRIAEMPAAACRKASFLAYLAMDVLVDATFDALEKFDDNVDRLEDEILEDSTTTHLSELQDLKHAATEMRRILGAQRDLFQRLLTHSLDEDRETTAYYRDVYDHVIRQYETVDSLRDLLTGAMDVYLSTVSNRLNLTLRTLTVIASLFLPLTFLTGFFGMNFAWLVSHIGSFYSFAIGLGVMVLSILLQLVVFRRRGWI